MVVMTTSTDTTNFMSIIPLQIRTTILILLNVFVRIWFPSAYYPATASIKGFWASPLTARCIAFIAEFSMYEIWAVLASTNFWGQDNVWLLVLSEEIISETGVLLQNELLLNIEDTTWAVHAWYMFYLSHRNNTPLPQPIFFYGFGAYLILHYLSRRINIIIKGNRSVLNNDNTPTVASYFKCINPISITENVTFQRCAF